MYSRHDLTDQEYQRIELLLPPERSRQPGRPYKSHRLVLCGIAWILATGSPWRDLPEHVFGPWKTIYNRYRRWVAQGLFEQLWQTLLWHKDEQGQLHRELFCVDATIVRAHQSAAGARHDTKHPNEPDDHALGRSQGGFSTKIHLLIDAVGAVVQVLLTAGQAGETKQLIPLLQPTQVLDVSNPSKTPEALAGDKGYSSVNNRAVLEGLQIEDVIARRVNEHRDPNFDKAKYKHRNIVERVIGWLKWYRRIATRYEKTAVSYLAMIHFAIFRRLNRLN